MRPTKNTVKIANFGTEIRSQHLTLAIGIPLNQPHLLFRFEGAKIDPHSLTNCGCVPSKPTGHWNTAYLVHNNEQLAF
jgi:hypothetical protein